MTAFKIQKNKIKIATRSQDDITLGTFKYPSQNVKFDYSTIFLFEDIFLVIKVDTHYMIKNKSTKNHFENRTQSQNLFSGVKKNDM